MDENDERELEVMEAYAQAAFYAHATKNGLGGVLASWSNLGPRQKLAWCAAANAVLDLHDGEWQNSKAGM